MVLECDAILADCGPGRIRWPELLMIVQAGLLLEGIVFDAGIGHRIYPTHNCLAVDIRLDFNRFDVYLVYEILDFFHQLCGCYFTPPSYGVDTSVA